MIPSSVRSGIWSYPSCRTSGSLLADAAASRRCVYSAPGCVSTLTLMFGVAELKSSTIFLKKLPSGPVNAFHTVRSTLPAGGWNALAPALPLALPLGLPDSGPVGLGLDGLSAPALDEGDAPPGLEDDVPPELLLPHAATTRTSAADVATRRRRQVKSDMDSLLRAALPPATPGVPPEASDPDGSPGTIPQQKDITAASQRCPLQAACNAAPQALIGRAQRLSRESVIRRRVAARPGGAFMPARFLTRRRLGARVPLALLLALLVGASLAAPATAATGTYRNPLRPQIPGDGTVESCADPSVIRGQENEGYWYLYCTSDPLNDADRTGDAFNFHLVPQMRSRDLVHWTYVGDAFGSRPSWATPTAGIWAPEIEYDATATRYLLYVTVPDTTFPGGGSAIAVATSDTPIGPWTWAADPVVEPHGADCCGPDSRRWVFDPEVIQTGGAAYIYYGSYFGGISVRRLSADLTTSDPATQTNVAIANKYEGSEVVERNGWFYLFVSATDCCRGPLSGYAVFVGRSHSPTGPFLDRSGVDLNDNEMPDDPTDGRAGGSPVIVGNDAPWVGTGHNTVFQDLSGQWWTIYHAINRNDPYFQNGVDIFA